MVILLNFLANADIIISYINQKQKTRPLRLVLLRFAVRRNTMEYTRRSS